MYFKNIIGLETTKVLLRRIHQSNRIAHAFFFVGLSGYGGLSLVIAYARMLLNEKKDPITDLKIDKLQHPDLHFIFPIASNDAIKRSSISLNFLNEWREFINTYPYGNLFDWIKYLKIEHKKVYIGVEQANYIIENSQLKSYEGGYKVLIVWMPERLHLMAANKLLKILEEPTEKTVFLFVGEDEEGLLPILRSRMQIFHLKPLSLDQMQILLQREQGISKKQALVISKRSEGQWGRALSWIKKNRESKFEDLFIHWTRNIFMAKKNPTAIKILIECSEVIHQWGKETQKQFLDYALYVFRQALLTKYKVESINFNPIHSEKFNWKAFSKYIQVSNIPNIFKKIEQANRDIEQNAYTKMVFLDLSIHMIKYLHNEKTFPLE